MILTLQNKEHLADNIWAFRFTTSKPLKYTAGQFVRVELPHDTPDDEGIMRWFTNSAAPFQGILQITTRLTDSSFKQALGKLEIGSTDLGLIDLPEGDFTWDDSAKSKIFIAGGIGITPYYSILKQRAHDKQALDVMLLYNGRSDEVPFRDEFKTWAQEDSHFIYKEMFGEKLSAYEIMRTIPKFYESLVYLSGPEPMVETIGSDLKNNGLSDKQLKQDYFPNYNEENY